MSFKQVTRLGHLGPHLATLPQGEGILAHLAALQKQALLPNPSATNRHLPGEPATTATCHQLPAQSGQQSGQTFQ